MQHPRLYEIYDAIDANDEERARELLRQQLQEAPSAEAYYLASVVALNEEQRTEFLKRALELDPFHVKASEAYYRHHPTPPTTPVWEKPKRERVYAPAEKRVDAYVLADIGQRFGAWVIDQIVLFGVSFVLGLFLVPLLGIDTFSSFEEQSRSQTQLQLVGLVIQTIYYVIFLVSWEGQTPGKRAMKIRVVKMNNQPLTVVDALIRNGLGYFVSAFVIFLGFIWAFFDPNRQAWHDKMAATLVVKD